ncbi:12078_t:CDS:2 [Ambispora gerdemannii]|uniref:12078_t:CDS:1 n=1 Tax=Ambispora gerdemannii TaxID=144530 RepID=A0A9N8VPZ0_9GLOM|nr:12078_t:CDS:2 [Ambispora gerdemannii]
MTTTFELFLPLIKEVQKYADRVLECYENAEYNKRVCGVLLKRVYSVAGEVKVLRHLNSNYSWFFENSENYPIFQGFVKVIGKIQNFVIDISQLQGVGKYFNEYRGPEFSMERTFYSLIGEFEKSTEALTHALKGHLYFGRPKTDQNIEDKEAIDQDIRDMENYIGSIAGGIADGQNILEEVGTVATLNKTFQRKEHIVLFDEVLDDAVLKIENFQYTDVRYNEALKYVRYDNVEVAFKEVEVDKETKDNIKKEVTILKKLKGAENIIVFHGVIIEPNKVFLVTEWATESSLKDFYQRRRLDWSLQIQFALDISRGLTYLKSAEILHHDIRSQNIFITKGNPQYTAKIGNFGLSRGLRDATRNIREGVDNVRYMAPEKLKENKHPYDFKCEIYSFGVLLWEIAEQRVPFQNIENDIVGIRQRVIDNKREQFSLPLQVPNKWAEIVYKTTNFNPMNRPTLTTIFTELFDLSKTHLPATQHPIMFQNVFYPSNPRPFYTVQDAINLHKIKGGDRKEAYKIFCNYADVGDSTAKYWVGYYLYYNCLDNKETYEQRQNTIVRAAQYFKETADMDVPEAQLRYGHCLWKGEGIEKNGSLAVEYFLKSAHNGNSTAMYNVGNMYFNGNGVIQDKEKGAYFLKRAALMGQPKAIEICKKNFIRL